MGLSSPLCAQSAASAGSRSLGGLVIGTPLGGLLAKTFGITAPFWFAFAGSALLVGDPVAQVRHDRAFLD